MAFDGAALRGIAEKARARALLVATTPALRWRAIAAVAVAFIVLKSLRVLFAPFFVDTSTFGFRDWDTHSAYRYITALALKRYHELPFWHPWFCGGFPAWAYVEGATNLVSPYLPFYLLFPVQIAERLEVICSTACAFGFTYLLAGRVTKSAGIRALVAVAYAFNGRWVMQFSEGHTWHLQYAWLPLVLFCFDVSLEPRKLRWAFGAGAVMALTAFMGGIYPLPHTALVLIFYAGILAATKRSAVPLYALCIAGVTALGLSAPKLFPVAELMLRVPRRIDSTEALGLGQLLAVFTESTGTVDHDPPVGGLAYAWLEYGIYIGYWLTGALVLGVVGMAARGKPTAFRAAGLLFLVLGCGAFHKYAPWTLLHEVPPFSSQHVPTRFLLPALLLLMLAFASMLSGFLERAVARRPWIDLALLVPVYFVAMDMVDVGRQSTKQLFMFKGPSVVEASKEFHHVTDTTYRYDPDWRQAGRQELLAMYANTGLIRCYGIPTELVPGAIAQGAAGYRGEAYLVGPDQGTARVTDWSPNTATVHYEGARYGATLVYNMNFDPGWRANGHAATSYNRAVSTRVYASSGEVTFRYSPPLFGWGLIAFGLTALVALGGPGPMAKSIRRAIEARKRAVSSKEAAAVQAARPRPSPPDESAVAPTASPATDAADAKQPTDG